MEAVQPDRNENVKTKNLTFGQALQALKEGKSIKRSIWGGRWYLAKDARLSGPSPIGGGYTMACQFSNIIVAELKDNGGVAPAQPYQADLLAEDWEVVN